MKKYSSILLAVLALGLASCEDKSDLGTAQVNPQGPVFSAENVVYVPFTYINASDPNVKEVDLGYYDIEGMPEEFVVSGTFQLARTEDFANPIQVPVTTRDNHVFASIGDIASQYTEKYSKSPETVVLFGRTSLVASFGNESVAIGSLGTYYGTDSYTYTPVPAENILDNAYYLMLGDGKEWDYTSAVMFKHSDINQYDDPNFTLVLQKGSSLGNKWIIMPEDEFTLAYNDKNLNGKTCLVPVFDRIANGVTSGDFEKVTDGNIEADATIDVPCELSVNVADLTYSFKPAVEAYYATGNGWSNWGARWMPLTTSDFTNYYGFLNLETEFKFSPQQGWGGDFGAAAAPAETVNNGIYSYSGKCHDGSGNIQINHAGLYFCSLNANEWSFTLQQTASWGLIGDFNGWGGDIAMTPSEDLYTWTADLTVAEGQGWKFRANADWAVNLGGTAGSLTSNGDNIVLPAGTYTITLDLTTYPAKFTAAKK